MGVLVWLIVIYTEGKNHCSIYIYIYLFIYIEELIYKKSMVSGKVLTLLEL